MDQLEAEQALAKRDRIPAYWLPSLTPAAETKVEDVVRKTEEVLEKGLSTKCYVGDKFGHTVRCVAAQPFCREQALTPPNMTCSIKTLVDVHFVNEQTPGEGQKKHLCPSCKKSISSVNKLFGESTLSPVFEVDR